MKIKGLVPAFVGILLSSVVFAAEPAKVKEIAVEVDLTAVTNPAAAARYANIADDLQSALAARLTDRIAEDGMRVSVDISEVELTNSFQDAMGLANGQLAGTVMISDENDNTHFNAYKLMVSLDQAGKYIPEGADLTKLTASNDEYYSAIVDAFADAVVARLVN